MRRICWITFSTLEKRGDVFYSPFASTRYRVLIPARWLEARGYSQSIVSAEQPEAAMSAAMNADVIIFSKSNQPSNEEILAAAQRAGAKVIVDLCDYKFDMKQKGDHDRAMLARADALVANTQEMAAAISDETGREAAVIGDPYEGPKGVAEWKWRPGRRIEALWFGHPVNLDTLEVLLSQLAVRKAEVALSVRICTRPRVGLEEECRIFNRQVGNRVKVYIVPWSVEQVWKELRETDMVLLPSRVGMEKKDVKSPNRLVESVWAGRFALASALPAYQPFAEWIPLGDDFCANLDWVMSHQSEIVPRIHAAQDFVAAHYSPEVIGKQWEAVIEA
ncbi:MAG: hypothetical protein Q8L39_16665 [Burkholderiales bacterium]|nr:hypothetical protein [Burkholderiales bacterium]